MKTALHAILPLLLLASGAFAAPAQEWLARVASGPEQGARAGRRTD